MSETLRDQLREVVIAECGEAYESATHAPGQVRELLAKAFEYGWGRDEFRSRVVLEFQRRLDDDGCVPEDSPGIERVSVLHDASTFDDGLADRLIRETLEDHARMTSGPWRYDHQGWIESMDRTINHTGSETEVLVLGARNASEDGDGVARLRNNAPDLAKQLKAAIARAEGCRRALALQLDKLPEYAAEIERLTKERDDLKHDLDLSLPER